MDDLVYVCTKIARQMDTDGLDKMFEAAASANTAIEEGRPLLQQASAIAREVHPYCLLRRCRHMCLLCPASCQVQCPGQRLPVSAGRRSPAAQRVHDVMHVLMCIRSRGIGHLLACVWVSCVA